jgi:hypothetical protein
LSAPKLWMHDDFLFEEHHVKDKTDIAKHKPPVSLTTEQLMEAAIETAKQMTEDEKAKLRDELRADLRMPKRVLLTLPCSEWVN